MFPNAPGIAGIINKTASSDEIQYINYMLNQYGNGKKTICNGFATFNKNTLNYLYNEVDTDNHGEISGELDIIDTFDEINKSVFEIIIKKDTIKGGDNHEVDSIESLYNFHTHPLQSYKTIYSKYGWPSIDDYVVFIMAYLVDDEPTYFHWVCAMEGIYVLTIPENTINLIDLLKKDHKIEDKIESYLYKNRK